MNSNYLWEYIESFSAAHIYSYKTATSNLWTRGIIRTKSMAEWIYKISVDFLFVWLRYAFNMNEDSHSMHDCEKWQIISCEKQKQIISGQRKTNIGPGQHALISICTDKLGDMPMCSGAEGTIRCFIVWCHELTPTLGII